MLNYKYNKNVGGTNDVEVSRELYHRKSIFEDFILLIFVLTDDFYKSVAPDSVKFRSNIEKALLSDSEIITIAICGELIGIDSEKAWFNFVKRNLRHLFPKMCDRTRFNRTRRNLLQVMNLIFVKISSYLKDKFLIADSFPLEVCKFGRAHFCKAFKFEEQNTVIAPRKNRLISATKFMLLQLSTAQ